MSSNGASVGNFGGKLVATFTAAGQDTGAIGWLEVPPFYKARTFQLLVAAGAANNSVTVYGTLDVGTAAGTATSPYWEPIPGPSSETTPQWSNPLTVTAGQRLFYCNAPLAGVRLLSSASGGTWAGTVYVVMLAAS